MKIAIAIGAVQAINLRAMHHGMLPRLDLRVLPKNNVKLHKDIGTNVAVLVRELLQRYASKFVE